MAKRKECQAGGDNSPVESTLKEMMVLKGGGLCCGGGGECWHLRERWGGQIIRWNSF